MPVVEQTHTVSNPENFRESRICNARTDVRLFIPCQWNEYGCQHHTYNCMVLWNRRVCSQCISHLLTDTQGALYISTTGTLPLVPYRRQCISAAYCHRQCGVTISNPQENMHICRGGTPLCPNRRNSKSQAFGIEVMLTAVCDI